MMTGFSQEEIYSDTIVLGKILLIKTKNMLFLLDVVKSKQI